MIIFIWKHIGKILEKGLFSTFTDIHLIEQTLVEESQRFQIIISKKSTAMTMVIIRASSSLLQVLWLEELNLMSSDLGTIIVMIALFRRRTLAIVSQISSLTIYKFPILYYLIFTTALLFLCRVFKSSFHQWNAQGYQFTGTSAHKNDFHSQMSSDLPWHI